MTDKDTFMLVSLQEKQSKQLATVLANPTARKILDYLAKHSKATETSLASKLKIPLSTVHYNLKQLVKGHLVKAEEYHYSQKGREVSHYSLANKYIIISPRPMWDIREKLKHVLPITIVAGGVAWFLQMLQRPYYIVQDIIPKAARETIQETVTKVPFADVDDVAKAAIDVGVEETKRAAFDMATDSIAQGAPAVSQKIAALSTQPASQEVIKETVRTVTHPAPEIVQQAFTANVGLYFFAGFLVAVVLYLLYDYYKSKK
ncbi:MAG: ArsR/SmtB family transcription factor [Candidatus Nanoarchaeia archaeon]